MFRVPAGTRQCCGPLRRGIRYRQRYSAWQFPAGLYPCRPDQCCSGASGARTTMKRPAGSLWAFVATLVLTGLLAASQSLGYTRMNIPYMLGSMFTPDRDKAKLAGFGVHLINGWAFGLLYEAVFENWRASG